MSSLTIEGAVIAERSNELQEVQCPKSHFYRSFFDSEAKQTGLLCLAELYQALAMHYHYFQGSSTDYLFLGLLYDFWQQISV